MFQNLIYLLNDRLALESILSFGHHSYSNSCLYDSMKQGERHKDHNVALGITSGLPKHKYTTILGQ